jgi:hypothetical protein
MLSVGVQFYICIDISSFWGHVNSQSFFVMHEIVQIQIVMLSSESAHNNNPRRVGWPLLCIHNVLCVI